MKNEYLLFLTIPIVLFSCSSGSQVSSYSDDDGIYFFPEEEQEIVVESRLSEEPDSLLPGYAYSESFDYYDPNYNEYMPTSEGYAVGGYGDTYTTNNYYNDYNDINYGYGQNGMSYWGTPYYGSGICYGMGYNSWPFGYQSRYYWNDPVIVYNIVVQGNYKKRKRVYRPKPKNPKGGGSGNGSGSGGTENNSGQEAIAVISNSGPAKVNTQSQPVKAETYHYDPVQKRYFKKVRTSEGASTRVYLQGSKEKTSTEIKNNPFSNDIVKTSYRNRNQTERGSLGTQPERTSASRPSGVVVSKPASTTTGSNRSTNQRAKSTSSSRPVQQSSSSYTQKRSNTSYTRPQSSTPSRQKPASARIPSKPSNNTSSQQRNSYRSQPSNNRSSSQRSAGSKSSSSSSKSSGNTYRSKPSKSSSSGYRSSGSSRSSSSSHRSSGSSRSSSNQGMSRKR